MFFKLHKVYLSFVCLILFLLLTACDGNSTVESSQLVVLNPTVENLTDSSLTKSTETPTFEPTETPTFEPTETPTFEPTEASTEEPTATFVPEPTTEPTSIFTPTTVLQNQPFGLAWLVTTEEVNTFAENLGIAGFEVNDEFESEDRVCRQFLGYSWSVSPNMSVNCVFKTTNTVPFDDLILNLFEWDSIPPEFTKLESTITYNNDFALYSIMGSNGHSVYYAFLRGDEVLYFVVITLGTSGGDTPEALHADHGEIIDAFLDEVFNVNIERSQ